MDDFPKPRGPSTAASEPLPSAPDSAAPLASSSPLASIDSSTPAPAARAPDTSSSTLPYADQPIEESAELLTASGEGDRAAFHGSNEREPSGDSEERQFTAKEKGKGKAVQKVGMGPQELAKALAGFTLPSSPPTAVAEAVSSAPHSVLTPAPVSSTPSSTFTPGVVPAVPATALSATQAVPSFDADEPLSHAQATPAPSLNASSAPALNSSPSARPLQEAQPSSHQPSMNQCPPPEPVPASGSPFPAGHPAPASPLTGAISSTKSSSSTALPHHAEPLEEEWLLKSITWPPLPPPPNSHPDSYDAGQSSKGFETDERLRVKIIQQNRNGPCSLIALCNILILRNDIHIAPGRDRVTYSFLSNLLADYFLRVTTTTPSSEAPPSPTSPTTTQLSLEAALSILPSTQSGLNLNPQFSRINGFVSTPSSGAGELALFSLAQIPLLHGWLADPADQETYEALREAGDYDRALEMVVEGSEIAGGRLELREDEMSDEELVKEAERRSSWTPLQEQKVRKAHLINTFLNSTSTQLTYPGLFTLSSTPSLLPPSGLAALFRNSHLSVLYRRPSSPSSTFNAAASHGGPELFTLVTDSSFAGEEEVVWESLEDTDGSGSEFYTAALRRSRTRGGDWAGVRAEEQQADRGRTSAREEADLALAHRLQAEENDRAAYAYERERERHRHAQVQQELDDVDSDDASSLDDAPRGARAPPPTPYASRTTTTTAKAQDRKEGQGGKAASGAATGARRTSKGGKPKAEKDKCVVM
ncbi:hypothetical protein JCM21900_005292 [Sporobolomyces salmonicolor]